MRHVLPLALLLLAAALGWWLLAASGEDPADSELEADALPDPAADGGDLGARPMQAKGLAVKGTRPGRKRPAPVIADPRTLPKGNLAVRMLGPDLKPLDAGDLRVYVEPGTGAAWRTRLGTYDKEAQAWSFRDVVAGPVHVRVQGDHVVGRTVEATVRRDRDNELSVPLDRAGAIRYDVVAYDKTRPDPVKLTLHDHGGRPVAAWYQERTSRRMTTPKLLETAEIGPEGVVFGILPGRYRLRVVSPAEEWDDAEVDVVAGKTVPVSLEVRR